MADNYKPAGYQNSLMFDPSRGVIKYGNYEFFADQVGVKPQTQTFTFDKYKQSLQAAGGITPFTGMNEQQMRAQFAKDVESGALREAPKPTGMAAVLYNAPAYDRVNVSRNTNGIDAIGMAPIPEYRNVQQKDADTYSVTSYDIPKDIEFVNRLNADAANLSANAAQGQVTDSSRPNPNNARLGKPNYSRAATILAGEQAPLGGAATTLGA